MLRVPKSDNQKGFIGSRRAPSGGLVARKAGFWAQRVRDAFGFGLSHLHPLAKVISNQIDVESLKFRTPEGHHRSAASDFGTFDGFSKNSISTCGVDRN